MVLIIDILLDLFLFLFPIYFIYFFNRNIKLKDIFKQLGLKKIKLKELFKKSIILYSSIFLLSVLLSILFFIIGISDLHLVSDVISSIPIYYILYLFFIRVFLEEWFFRGFLVKKTGVWISSIIFGLAHFSYGSYIEVFGAFVLGLLLAYSYKKNKNLLPNYVAHLLYNFSAYALLFIM